VTSGFGRAGFSNLVVGGAGVLIDRVTAVTWGGGSFASGALTWQNCSLPVSGAAFTPQIGGSAGVLLRTPRAARLVVNSVTGAIGECVFAGAGANPAIKVNNYCHLSFAAGVCSGTTGNNDVGLDLTNAFNSQILVFTTPTVTGALGDVRLAGGQIITWAQAIAGVIDSQGNRISGSLQPLAMLKFAGALLGGAGLVNSYLADDAPALIVANSLVAIRYPTSQRLFTRLRVTVLALSTNTINNTVTLYKNGVATTMLVTIPAATAAFTKFVDSAHPILFADGDDLALRMDNAGADVAAVTAIAASLEYPL
jgi:hypothetical protein